MKRKEKLPPVRYYVTASVVCPECRGGGRIGPDAPEDTREFGTKLVVLCLVCDGTGEVRMDAPFADALSSTLAELEQQSDGA